MLRLLDGEIGKICYYNLDCRNRMPGDAQDTRKNLSGICEISVVRYDATPHNLPKVRSSQCLAENLHHSLE
jgi:hypothetical protein